MPDTISLASCGHLRNADGECDCSYWPERAPHIRDCNICGNTLHLVTSTENGKPWQGWMHDGACADWMCGRG